MVDLAARGAVASAMNGGLEGRRGCRSTGLLGPAWPAAPIPAFMADLAARGAVASAMNDEPASLPCRGATRGRGGQGWCVRLGRRTVARLEALPSGASRSRSKRSGERRRGAGSQGLVRLAWPAHRGAAGRHCRAERVGADRSAAESGDEGASARRGACGLAGAPQRGPTHCRAERVGADRSAAESGDEDLVKAVEQRVLGEAVEAVLDAQGQRRVDALDRGQVRGGRPGQLLE